MPVRIYESGVCELAELSGQYTENNPLTGISWKCRRPTEIELEIWTAKYQTKIDKKNVCEAENTVQDNVLMRPKVRYLNSVASNALIVFSRQSLFTYL